MTKMGSLLNWPQNRLYWGEGSERLARREGGGGGGGEAAIQVKQVLLFVFTKQ